MRLIFCYFTILFFCILSAFTPTHAAPTTVSQIDESELPRKVSKLLDDHEERNLESIKQVLCSMKVRCDESGVKRYELGTNSKCPYYKLFLYNADCN